MNLVGAHATMNTAAGSKGSGTEGTIGSRLEVFSCRRLTKREALQINRDNPHQRLKRIASAVGLAEPFSPAPCSSAVDLIGYIPAVFVVVVVVVVYALVAGSAFDAAQLYAATAKIPYRQSVVLNSQTSSASEFDEAALVCRGLLEQVSADVGTAPADTCRCRPPELAFSAAASSAVAADTLLGLQQREET